MFTLLTTCRWRWNELGEETKLGGLEGVSLPTLFTNHRMEGSATTKTVQSINGFSKMWTYGTQRFKDRSVVLVFWPNGQTYGQKNPFSAISPEKLRVELKDRIPVGYGSTSIPQVE
jgi:hypothetical protein